MATTREILSFVVDADTSKAVAGFKAVEKSSGSALDTTEKSSSNLGSTLTKVGAASIAAGAAVAAGLVGTVKAFEKSEESADKFQTAVSGMGSHIDTGEIQKLAFQLQQVSKATDNQITAAARWGAVYGLTTDQLKQLLRVAVDLSAQTGQSIDATTKALARAASGGSDKVLVKWGVQMDETARKADAFGTTVGAAMDFAGGAAAKQADTMSGQLDRMGHNFTDVKEKIGAGANEVFEPLARGAANLSQKVAELNPEVLKTVGHFAAVGSMGVTAFGGLASLGGQLANLREGFSGIGGVADKFGLSLSKTGEDGTKSLTKLGGAMAGLGAVGAAVAIFEVGQALENATENARGFDTAMKQLALAKTVDQQGKAIKSATEDTKGFFDKTTGWVQGLFGGELTIKIGKSEVAVHQLNEAFDQMADKDPAQTLHDLPAVLDAATAASERWQKEHKGNAEALAANPYASTVKHLSDLKTGLEQSADATKKLAAQQGTAADPTLTMADALKEEHGALQFVALGAQQAAAAGKGLSDAFEAMDTDEQVTSALKLGDAFHGVEDSVKDLPKNFDETQAALGGYNDEQSKAIKAVTDWGDAAKGQIQTLIESGASHDVVTAKADTYRNALTGVMKQAGFTDAQIEDYQKTLGLTKPQVETAIQLSGDEEAKFQLGFLQGQMDQLSKPVQAKVTQLILMGDYQGAQAAAQADMQKRANNNPITQPVKLNYVAAAATAALPPWMRPGGQSAPPAPGAPSINPMATTAPVAMGSPTTNISITMPAGTTPANTLRAIRRYQRLGGDMGGLLDTVVAIR